MKRIKHFRFDCAGYLCMRRDWARQHICRADGRRYIMWKTTVAGVGDGDGCFEVHEDGGTVHTEGFFSASKGLASSVLKKASSAIKGATSQFKEFPEYKDATDAFKKVRGVLQSICDAHFSVHSAEEVKELLEEIYTDWERVQLAVTGFMGKDHKLKPPDDWNLGRPEFHGGIPAEDAATAMASDIAILEGLIKKFKDAKYKSLAEKCLKAVTEHRSNVLHENLDKKNSAPAPQQQHQQVQQQQAQQQQQQNNTVQQQPPPPPPSPAQPVPYNQYAPPPPTQPAPYRPYAPPPPPTQPVPYQPYAPPPPPPQPVAYPPYAPPPPPPQPAPYYQYAPPPAQNLQQAQPSHFGPYGDGSNLHQGSQINLQSSQQKRRTERAAGKKTSTALVLWKSSVSPSADATGDTKESRIFQGMDGSEDTRVQMGGKIGDARKAMTRLRTNGLLRKTFVQPGDALKELGKMLSDIQKIRIADFSSYSEAPIRKLYESLNKRISTIKEFIGTYPELYTSKEYSNLREHYSDKPALMIDRDRMDNFSSQFKSSHDAFVHDSRKIRRLQVDMNSEYARTQTKAAADEIERLTEQSFKGTPGRYAEAERHVPRVPEGDQRDEERDVDDGRYSREEVEEAYRQAQSGADQDNLQQRLRDTLEQIKELQYELTKERKSQALQEQNNARPSYPQSVAPNYMSYYSHHAVPPYSHHAVQPVPMPYYHPPHAYRPQVRRKCMQHHADR